MARLCALVKCRASAAASASACALGTSFPSQPVVVRGVDVSWNGMHSNRRSPESSCRPLYPTDFPNFPDSPLSLDLPLLPDSPLSPHVMQGAANFPFPSLQASLIQRVRQAST